MPPRRTRRGLQELLLMLVLGLLAGGAELLVRGLVPVRNVGPSFSEYHPRYLKGLRANATLPRVTPEFSMRLTTNSKGMRGPEPMLGQAGTRRILFAGDSYTMGYGVDDGREFPALVRSDLQERLGAGTPVEVWNAGVGNSGTARLLRWLEDAPEDLQPDLVVYQFCVNDFVDNPREDLYELDAEGRLWRRPIQDPNAVRQLQALVDTLPWLSHSHLFSLVRQTATLLLTEGRDPAAGVVRSPEDGQLTFALVEAVLNRWATSGVPILALTLEQGPHLARLAELFDAAGAEHVVIPDKPSRPDLYYRIDAHWNEAGHRHVADELGPRILRRLARDSSRALRTPRELPPIPPRPVRPGV